MDTTLLDNLLNLLLPTLILLHLVGSPYTKVEESFGLQATHDVLHYGLPWANSTAVLQNFDHATFPGSVPRTFVGPLVLAGSSMPFASFLTRPETQQLLVRVVLGLANAAALVFVRGAVETAFGKAAGRWYVLLQACQFHVIYYASRTLPNMFAFLLVTVAQRNLILVKALPAKSAKTQKRRRLGLYLLTLAGVVFRAEVAVLLAAEVGVMLYRGRVNVVKEIVTPGLIGAAVGLGLTVSIDSFFWQSFPLWPEWVGFYYNTILGNSSAWGTEPWDYYFTSALPRLLWTPAIWPLCALIPTPARKTAQDILLPHLVFVAVYSLLPHKEARFIIYAVPAFTAAASATAGNLWTRRAQGSFTRLLSNLLLASTALALLASTATLYVSSLNYPGAEALARLHVLTAGTAEASAPLNIHMDNLACQTGVTRFQQTNPNWTYDKSDNGTELLEPEFWARFDYALTEQPERVIGKWEIAGVAKGLAGFTLTPEEGVEMMPLPAHLEAIVVVAKAKAVYERVARVLSKGRKWPVPKVEEKVWILRKERERGEQPPAL